MKEEHVPKGEEKILAELSYPTLDSDILFIIICAAVSLFFST
jgi:hypothetical protein